MKNKGPVISSPSQNEQPKISPLSQPAQSNPIHTDLFEPKCQGDKYSVTRTEIRRHLYAILRFLDKRDSLGIPTMVFITYKGKEDLVLMSVRTFTAIFGQEQLDRLLSGEKGLAQNMPYDPEK